MRVLNQIRQLVYVASACAILAMCGCNSGNSEDLSSLKKDIKDLKKQNKQLAKKVSNLEKSNSNKNKLGILEGTELVLKNKDGKVWFSTSLEVHETDKKVKVFTPTIYMTAMSESSSYYSSTFTPKSLMFIAETQDKKYRHIGFVAAGEFTTQNKKKKASFSPDSTERILLKKDEI